MTFISSCRVFGTGGRGVFDRCPLPAHPITGLLLRMLTCHLKGGSTVNNMVSLLW